MVSAIGQRRRATAARAKLAETPSVDRYQARMALLANVRRRHRADHKTQWCILRTNARQTLGLVESLLEAGIEAWAPSSCRRRRLPRGRKGFREIEEPIAPGFVFADAERLPDIVRALAMPVSPHPRFSLFRHAGRTPIVADRDIADLRTAEEQSRGMTAKARRARVAVGDAVPGEGAFAGLDGVVETVAGNSAVVLFNGSLRVKIATWLIAPDDVDQPAAQMGAAA